MILWKYWLINKIAFLRAVTGVLKYQQRVSDNNIVNGDYLPSGGLSAWLPLMA